MPSVALAFHVTPRKNQRLSLANSLKAANFSLTFGGLFSGFFFFFLWGLRWVLCWWAVFWGVCFFCLVCRSKEATASAYTGAPPPPVQLHLSKIPHESLSTSFPYSHASQTSLPRPLSLPNRKLFKAKSTNLPSIHFLPPPPLSRPRLTSRRFSNRKKIPPTLPVSSLFHISLVLVALF